MLMMNTILSKSKENKLILEVLTKIVILIATVIRYIYLDWTLSFKMLFETQNTCRYPFILILFQNVVTLKIGDGKLSKSH